VFINEKDLKKTYHYSYKILDGKLKKNPMLIADYQFGEIINKLIKETHYQPGN
jgi:hypothetical protein